MISSTRMELLPNVWLTAVQTDKFKSGAMSATLLTQPGREFCAADRIIPSVLRRGTCGSPTMEALSARLDELYGMEAEPSVRSYGEVAGLGFQTFFCEGRFLPENLDTAAEAAKLLGELWMNPLTRGGRLLPDYVNSERDKALERLEGIINNKRGYAMQRLREEMCCCEEYGISIRERMAATEEIRYLSLTKHYRERLGSCPLELFYCGSEEPERIADLLHDVFLPMPRAGEMPDLGTDVRFDPLEDKPRFFDEAMEVEQGQLALGFRLGDFMEEPDPAVLKVFNTLYGGGATSRLFRNVREKLSLCYYAYSTCDIYKGVMFALAGIDPANRDRAQEEILAQLEDLKQGRIAEEELDAARRQLADALRSVEDSASQLENYYVNNVVLGLEESPSELAEEVLAVTADEVAEAAAGIALDAVYFLHGEDQE